MCINWKIKCLKTHFRSISEFQHSLNCSGNESHLHSSESSILPHIPLSQAMFHYYPPIHAYISYSPLPWRLLTWSSIHSSSPPTTDTHRASCKKIYKILHISCPMYPFVYYPYHTTYIINTAYVMYSPLLPSNEVFRCFPSCHLFFLQRPISFHCGISCTQLGFILSSFL